MNKGIRLCAFLMLISLVAVSCKRKHICTCNVYGELDTVFFREYRGYTPAEARRVCQTDNIRSTATYTVECDIR